MCIKLTFAVFVDQHRKAPAYNPVFLNKYITFSQGEFEIYRSIPSTAPSYLITQCDKVIYPKYLAL